MEISEEIKKEFYQAVAMSVLLYAETSWVLKKLLEKKAR